jgi:DNA polymerase-3 subunit delta'
MLLHQIVGQDQAVALLARAAGGGRLAHAYLFDGPDGVGKRSVALALALTLCCEKAPGRGCGHCDTCRRVTQGQHPDVLSFAPATQQYLVDQVREVVALAMARPHEATARVLILDQADRLNSSSANCLLKTLEEPLPGNHLVLITSAPDRLLPTIRSRTQRVRFSFLASSALAEIARRLGASSARAETAVALAGGQADRLVQILGSEAESELWPAVSKLRQAAAAKGISPIFAAAAELSDKESRHDLPRALELLARFYRDALTVSIGAADLAMCRDRQPELASLAERARRDRDLRTLRASLGAVVDASTALSSNVNPAAALEKMLMDLRALEMPLA